MIPSALFAIILIGVVALMITAALAPLETLSWWGGWTEEELGEDPPPESSQPQTPRHYIVYLSGVASISGRFLLPREKAFIRLLRQRFPEAVIVSDVFPYSPKGLPLLESPRLFDQLWRRAQLFKIKERQTILSALINLRNIFQVMVSADHRYGPIFNQGAASVIEKALIDDGYARGSGAAVTIIGYSGGAQVAAGAATFLTARLRAPIDIISIGGVLASDPGLNYVRKLDHVIGARDNIERFGAILFPERWPLMATSEWNAGKRDGRIHAHILPGMTHAGVDGYFGRPYVNGASNAQRTLEAIAALI
ncbi:hypothetical protein [Hyphococcus sp.]|uniref:hypothetical protein n=1 Tax=Hyphococcus sp. TaxID=2038636 RepID=UPI0020879831|nr:MAG: hypothetical protein DHS20C04_18000 [Marinicaulis sp.]